jgi:flagellar hook-basal body complex protein FliE
VIPAISAAIGPLGPAEWSVGSVPNVAADPTAATAAAMSPTAPTAATAVDGTSGTSFGGALTNAISALEQSQNKGASAAQALATGQATDPTQAVTAVENASLEMQLASQIRTKLGDAATTIFQTQV